MNLHTMKMEWKMNHAIVYPTVDCAIFSDGNHNKIYLAKKPNQPLWRFPGGFVDPKDISYEDAAIREAKEETNLDCFVIDYVGSTQVNDPRYKDKEDKIITSMYAMEAIHNDSEPKPMDDIAELKLFNTIDVSEDMIMPEHRNLFWELRNKYETFA